MLLFYCRAGFEADCAAEVEYLAALAGAAGECMHRRSQAFVQWRPDAQRSGRHAQWAPRLDEMVFARQLLSRCRRVERMAPQDRVGPLVQAAGGIGVRFARVVLEAPDAEPARSVLGAARTLVEALTTALREQNLILNSERGPGLHVCLLDAATAIIGMTDPRNSSPWPMGIPRLRYPAGAPSRSGMKLVEALATFIAERELPDRMRAGRMAVDLGAAPGGWSFVLAQRGLRVLAVDNGPIARAVLDTELVEHRRADAFRFRPERPVDWMVCDVVAAPARIAALAAQWIARGWCRETIFNLKLPGRQRWEEVLRCRAVIERALSSTSGRHELRIKHLYHDREEVTAHLRRL